MKNPNKQRLRRTMMFLNAQKPSLIKDPYIYKPDSIMLDLEDAVAENQKDAARFSLYHALKTIDYRGCERVVRINGLDTPYWKEDIRCSVAGGADTIRIPKTESAQDVKMVEWEIEKAEKEGLPTLTKIVKADIDLMIRRAADFDEFLKNMRELGYRIRVGKYITYYPPGLEKGRRDKTLGEGYSREEIASRIRNKDREKTGAPSVIGQRAMVRMEERLSPYLRVRLTPIQLVFIGRIHDVRHYLESKNPFAVKWYTVRKDAMETGKLFEECMYLLEHDIRDRDDLVRKGKDAGRKERNLIHRILKRTDEKEIQVPGRHLEIKADR